MSTSSVDRPNLSFCSVFLALYLGSPQHHADSRRCSLSKQAVHRRSPEEAVPETCQNSSSRCLGYLSKCRECCLLAPFVYRKNSSSYRMLIQESRPKHKATPYLRKTCSTCIRGRIRRNKSDRSRRGHSTGTCMRAIKGPRSSSRGGSGASSRRSIRPHTMSF